MTKDITFYVAEKYLEFFGTSIEKSVKINSYLGRCVFALSTLPIACLGLISIPIFTIEKLSLSIFNLIGYRLTSSCNKQKGINELKKIKEIIYFLEIVPIFYRIVVYDYRLFKKTVR